MPADRVLLDDLKRLFACGRGKVIGDIGSR